VPNIEWGAGPLVPVSIQSYNPQDDVEALLAALTVLLREV